MEFAKEDGFQPGAARLGNFINYYQFNSTSNRLKLLPADLITKLRCHTKVVAVDIGCNTGDMTAELYSHLTRNQEPGTSPEHAVYMLGIDVDPTLILRANEKNGHSNNIKYIVCDIMKDKSEEQLTGYLNRLDKPRFDIGFCLSVTMWIHLNHGDEGLVRFLRFASSLVKYLVVEPQPWKCYKSAVRRMRRLKQDDFPCFNTMKFRERIVEDIDTILTRDCGMTCGNSFGETQWKRPVLLYENSDYR